MSGTWPTWSSLTTDNRTLFGRTFGKIRNECGVASLSLLTPKHVKTHLKYFAVPQAESWRVNILKELLEARGKKCDITDFRREEISAMIDHICTS